MKVVLYDPDDPQTAISLTDDNPGKYALGWIGFDPQAGDDGQYTLVTVRTDPATDDTFLAIFQRNELLTWVFRYEFSAYTADPGLAGSQLTFHVTSPEPFQYGDFLYIAFVVADAPDFGSAQRGNIMLTRVESEDTEPEDYRFRILNACDVDADCDPTTVPTRKRIEPEIHFLPSLNPAVYYTWVAAANDGNCAEHEHKLMRAFTGDLWDD